MTSLKRSAHPGSARPRRSEQFKDEVYRQMFRLESSRPGAEMDLALALLRAWQAVDATPENPEERNWLRKVSPICMEMIEAALRGGESTTHSVQ